MTNQEYLEQIEKCYFFGDKGRRNNDIVNWTLAKMIQWIEDTGEEDAYDLSPDQLQEEFLEAFKNNRPRHALKNDLAVYEWEDKIDTVWSCYNRLDKRDLEDLFLDMDYDY